MIDEKIDEELKKCNTVHRGDFIEYWQGEALVHCSFVDGWKMWFDESSFSAAFHRENGPAVVKPDGTFYYYSHGKLHRENGPAIVRTNGTEEFWINGIRQDY